MTVPPGYHYMQAPDPMRPKIRFDAIGEAWTLFSQQMGPWIGAGLIVLAIYGCFYIAEIIWIFSNLKPLGPQPGGGPPPVAEMGATDIFFSLAGLVIWLVMAFLMTGMYRMAVRQVRGERIALRDLFSIGDVWLRSLGAYFLIGLVACVGFLLLIIPGFIFYGLLMLTIPLIVDKRLRVMEAMQLSWDSLKKDWLMAAVFYFITLIVGGVGICAFFIGLLFTFPLMFLSHAIVYRDFILTPQMMQAPPPAAFDLPPSGTMPPPPPEAPLG
ncbi:MAG TPA: hypothetical protein VKT32_01555 [Chthonomonadaceae bacterium]|nr:hypothetical protein [Chthonomonadaceae bacterium]